MPEMNTSLGIVVPYRNRQEHLDVFVGYLCDFFRRDKLNAGITPHILLVEQVAGLAFNRGAIKNIGFKYLAPEVDFVCFHDIDLLPVSADYRRSNNPAMIVSDGLDFTPEFIKHLFGGVVVIEKAHFAQANGFSNRYWGWGFEDVDLRERLLRINVRTEHRQGQFRKLPHIDEGSLPGGEPTEDHLKNKALYVNQWLRKLGQVFMRQSNAAGFWKEDGLNNLEFTEVDSRRPVSAAAPNGFHFERVTIALPYRV